MHNVQLLNKTLRNHGLSFTERIAIFEELNKLEYLDMQDNLMFIMKDRIPKLPFDISEMLADSKTVTAIDDNLDHFRYHHIFGATMLKPKDYGIIKHITC